MSADLPCPCECVTQDEEEGGGTDRDIKAAERAVNEYILILELKREIPSKR